MAKKSKKTHKKKDGNLGVYGRLPGDTMMERFNAMEDVFGAPPSYQQVCRFIAAENAKFEKKISPLPSDPDDEGRRWSVPNDVMNDCRQFFKFFLDKYWSNDEFRLVLNDYFPELPTIFEIGDYSLGKTSLVNCPDNLLPEQQHSYNKQLINYIFRQVSQKTIKFVVVSRDGKGVVQEAIKVQRNASREVLEKTKKEISDWLNAAMGYGGFVIVREDTPDGIVEYGFFVYQGTPQKITKRSLRYVAKRIDREAWANRANITFIEADLPYDPIKINWFSYVPQIIFSEVDRQEFEALYGKF